MKHIVTLLAACCQLATAGLQFERELNIVNAAVSDTAVSTEFRFTNKSDRKISISHVDPDCLCVGVEISDGKLDYAPGESGVIRATFNISNEIGTVEHALNVWLKGDPQDNPSIKLNLQIIIPELVALSDKSLKWEVGKEPAPKSIRITMQDAKPIQVTKIKSSKPDFSTQLVTIDDGRVYDLVVTPSQTQKPGMAIISIETNAPVEKYKKRQVFATVQKPAGE